MTVSFRTIEMTTRTSRFYPCFALVGMLLLGAVAVRGESTVSSARKDSPSTASTQNLLQPIIWGVENQWKLQMSGDIRVRFEHRDNWDMNKRIADNADPTFLRTRVNFDLTYRSFLRAVVTLLDARQFHTRPIDSGGIDPAWEDYFDVLQAFIEWSCPDSPWTARLGRLNLPNLGDNRLIQTSLWTNIPRAFEGAWLTHRTSDAEIHLFALQELIYQNQRNDDIISGRMHNKEHEFFYGAYGTFHSLAPHEFDLYFLGISDRDDQRTFPSAVKSEEGRYGTTDRYTVGTRWRGPLREDECGTLGYGFETAYQFGHRANDNIRAFMLHSDLNYQWTGAWKPKVILEGNLASGDRKDGDGVSNTFQPLYGGTHSPYGIMDFFRLSNLREIALTGSVTPSDKWKHQLEFHKLWLDSRTDSWCSAIPGSYPRDKTGNSGRDAGSEIDFISTYKLNKCTTFEMGAAHFFSGNFAENNGRPDDANYLYFQTQFTF
jgi:hypothetical protein